MSVTFYLTPGYTSFVGTNEASEWLEDKVNDLDFKKIKEIALEMGCPVKCKETGVTLDQFIKQYDLLDDLTLNFETETKGTSVKSSVVQVASGGGTSREIKEKLRMAVNVYLMIEAAKKKIILDMRSG